MELTELEAAGLNASLYGPPADRVWLYVHGKGGCKEEAADFAALACPRAGRYWRPTCRSTGHAAGTGCPWTPGTQRPSCGRCWAMPKGGGSIPPCGAPVWGAWFSLLAFAGERLEQALFVSPVVDMEGLIRDMMGVGRRQRGPTGGGRRAGHSLRGDPLLALPPVCPRPSGVPLAHSHRPAVRLRGRHAPPDGGRGLRPPVRRSTHRPGGR